MSHRTDFVSEQRSDNAALPDVRYLLENLGLGRALIKVGQRGVAIQVPPPPDDGNRVLAEAIKENSRLQYGAVIEPTPLRKDAVESAEKTNAPNVEPNSLSKEEALISKVVEKRRASDKLEDYFE
jgi:hypothetical protein